MSIKHLNDAFNADIKQSSLKFILVALADYANEIGEAYPSTETICNKTALNRKTVLGGLSKLSNLNFISDTKQRRGKTGQVKVWQLTISKGVKNGTVKESQKRNSPKNGTVPFLREKSPENGTLKQSQKRDIEPSVLLTISKPPDITSKSIPAGIDKKPWSEFLLSRKKLKASNSDYAINLLFNKIKIIRNAGYDLNDVINTAILKGWKGLDVSWLQNAGLKPVSANVLPDSLDWLPDEDRVIQGGAASG